MHAETAEPLDNLTPEVITWLSSLGCKFTKVSEVVANRPKEVFEAIQKGIDAANKKAISNAQKVQKFTLLPVDFSLPTGELGKCIRTILLLSIDHNEIMKILLLLIDTFHYI